jgi:hypothetical protein
MGSMLEPRRRSTLSKIDDWLLVGVVVVVAVAVLGILSWVASAIWFLAKVAVVAAVAGVVIAYINRRH